MDFVTITDHDTIDGALELADRADTFISEELTVWFKDEPQAVHVLCYGITPDDHDWLQAHNDDVEACAAYLARAGDHLRPGPPLLCGRGAAHRPPPPPAGPAVPDLGDPQRLPRQGAEPAGLHLHRDPRRHRRSAGPTTTPGSTSAAPTPQTPPAATPAEFLAHVSRRPRRAATASRAAPPSGRTRAMALAIRALGRGDGEAASDPRAVLTIVERLLREGDARSGATSRRPGPRGRPRAPARLAGGRRARRRPRGELLAVLQARTSATPTSPAAPAASTSASSPPRSTPSSP